MSRATTAMKTRQARKVTEIHPFDPDEERRPVRHCEECGKTLDGLNRTTRCRRFCSEIGAKRIAYCAARNTGNFC